jgi:hypothetical protein
VDKRENERKNEKARRIERNLFSLFLCKSEGKKSETAPVVV